MLATQIKLQHFSYMCKDINYENKKPNSIAETGKNKIEEVKFTLIKP